MTTKGQMIDASGKGTVKIKGKNNNKHSRQ